MFKLVIKSDFHILLWFFSLLFFFKITIPDNMKAEKIIAVSIKN